MIVREGNDFSSFGTLGEQREFERRFGPVKRAAHKAAKKYAAGCSSLPSSLDIHRAAVAAYKAAGFADLQPGFMAEFDAEVRRSFTPTGPNPRCWWYQTGVDDAKRKRKASVPSGFTPGQKKSYLAGYRSVVG